jgi:hypothetical protein
MDCDKCKRLTPIRCRRVDKMLCLDCADKYDGRKPSKTYHFENETLISTISASTKKEAIKKWKEQKQ